MKFSELKVDPNHHYVKMAEAGTPNLSKAMIEDYNEVHKEIIEMMGADHDLPEDKIQQYQDATNNYFLYFFYGMYKLLDIKSKTNEKWRVQLQDGMNQQLKQLGQTLKPKGEKSE